jgi:hypothetical protein
VFRERWRYFGKCATGGDVFEADKCLSEDSPLTVSFTA